MLSKSEASRIFRVLQRRDSSASLQNDIAKQSLGRSESSSCRRTAASRTASVIPLENGIQIKGMDLGFHRGDDNAGMTGLGVDFESTNSELLGLEQGGVQFWGGFTWVYWKGRRRRFSVSPTNAASPGRSRRRFTPRARNWRLHLPEKSWRSGFGRWRKGSARKSSCLAMSPKTKRSKKFSRRSNKSGADSIFWCTPSPSLTKKTCLILTRKPVALAST